MRPIFKLQRKWSFFLIRSMGSTFTVVGWLWRHSGRLTNIRLGLKCQTVTNVQVDSKKAFDSNCTRIWFFCKNPITFQRYLPPSVWPELGIFLPIGLLLKDHFDFLKRWSYLFMTAFWATFYVRIVYIFTWISICRAYLHILRFQMWFDVDVLDF